MLTCVSAHVCAGVHVFMDIETRNSDWVSSSVTLDFVYQGRVHLNPELACPADLASQLALGIHLYLFCTEIAGRLTCPVYSYELCIWVSNEDSWNSLFTILISS